MAENKSAKFASITEQISDEKARKRAPINFQLQLNEEQKRAKEVILDNTVTILSGQAGSGKTLLACQVGLDMLFKKQIKKIIITRPTVSKEEIGFLPGDLNQKMEPWMQPIYSNFYQLYNKEKIDKIIKDEMVEIVPLAFMRGRTFLDALVIVDEAQNCTNEQMSMIISRLGIRSKMIICGDTAQVDLKYKAESGFKFLVTVAKKVKDVESVVLATNHRHPVVEAMLEQYEEFFNKIENGTTNKGARKS
jgi:phosphate starvation-inducible PhoH-like protein